MTRSLFLAALGALLFAAVCAQAQDALIERGRYLVEGPMGCGNCHSPKGPGAADDLSGALVEDNPAFTAIAGNITPASHIAGWSDAELARAIREGLRPDGSLIGPPMPFSAYRGISDADLAAVVAYLRSVPAVDSDLPASEYRIPLPPAYGPPVDTVIAPQAEVTVAHGEYVALTLAHCMECHSTMTEKGPDYVNGLGAGGFAFHGPWGVSVAPNLTPMNLSQYSDAELAAMITDGTRPDGTPMKPPMPYPYLARMTQTDLDAVIAYLRALPPL